MIIPLWGLIIFIVALCFLVFLILYNKQKSRSAISQLIFDKSELEEQMEELDKGHRDGLARQRGLLIGDALEKFLPIFPGYKYNPKDVVYLGDTCDFLVLNGRTEGEIREVVFQEVKTGQSRLTSIQESFRECIDNNKIRFEEIHISQESDKFYLWEKPKSKRRILTKKSLPLDNSEKWIGDESLLLEKVLDDVDDEDEGEL